MSKLTRTEVDEIALLARLHLEPEERDRIQAELAAILESFSALAAVDVSAVAPMTHAVPMDLALRADLALPSLPVDAAMRGAPQHAGDVFVVPAVITGRE